VKLTLVESVIIFLSEGLPLEHNERTSQWNWGHYKLVWEIYPIGKG